MGQFAYCTFCLLDTLPTGYFAYETLPSGHFVYGPFCLLDSLPTIWTFHLQGQMYKLGKLLVSLYLLFEVWRVKSVCLISDQSTVCMERLLIFRIITELVQSWLKLLILLQTVHISVPNYVRA